MADRISKSEPIKTIRYSSLTNESALCQKGIAARLSFRLVRMSSLQGQCYNQIHLLEMKSKLNLIYISRLDLIIWFNESFSTSSFIFTFSRLSFEIFSCSKIYMGMQCEEFLHGQQQKLSLLLVIPFFRAEFMNLNFLWKLLPLCHV